VERRGGRSQTAIEGAGSDAAKTDSTANHGRQSCTGVKTRYKKGEWVTPFPFFLWRSLMTMRTKPWVQFLLCVFLFGLLLSLPKPYGSNLDFVIGCLVFALVLFLSVVTLRARWRHRHHPHIQASPDPGDAILRRVRRWYTDRRN